jgi:hypothetical protein
LCFVPAASLRFVALESAAFSAAAARVLSGDGAVSSTIAAPAPLRIGEVANLVQFLHGPRRFWDEPEREPAPNDRRRHITDGSRLPN